MPCDFLPLIGSAAGDWLGVRFDRDNHASEILQWYHGGGDWIPWGRTISEAIVFGAVADRLPGPKRRHSIPADDFQFRPASKDDPLLRWAEGHVGLDHHQITDSQFAGKELAEALLSERIAEAAVRCELIQDALAESLSEVLDRSVAESLGVPWHTAVRWIFDADQIPPQMRDQLKADFGCDWSGHQDWNRALQYAQHVTVQFPDVAWGWDVAGYCYEKLGQWSNAQQAYCQGIDQSVFSDQSVKLRTHWTAGEAAKFSVARLAALASDHAMPLPDEIDRDYFDLLSGSEVDRRRVEVQAYWLTRAAQSESASQKFDALVAAGWDLGAEPIKALAEILAQISIADPSQTARSTVSATHSECFRQRFGF